MGEREEITADRVRDWFANERRTAERIEARRDERGQWTVSAKGTVKPASPLSVLFKGFLRDVRVAYVDLPIRRRWLQIERSLTDRVVADVQRRLDVYQKSIVDVFCRLIETIDDVTRVAVRTEHEDGLYAFNDASSATGGTLPEVTIDFPGPLPKAGDVLRWPSPLGALAPARWYRVERVEFEVNERDGGMPILQVWPWGEDVEPRETVTLAVVMATGYHGPAPAGELTFPAGMLPTSNDTIQIGGRRFSCMGLGFAGENGKHRPVEIHLYPAYEPTPTGNRPMPDPEADRAPARED